MADGDICVSLNRECAYIWPGSRCGAKRRQNVDQRLCWDTRWVSSVSTNQRTIGVIYQSVISTLITWSEHTPPSVVSLCFLQGTCLQRCWKEKNMTPRLTTSLWGSHCLSSWLLRTHSGTGGRKLVASLLNHEIYLYLVHKKKMSDSVR